MIPASTHQGCNQYSDGTISDDTFVLIDESQGWTAAQVRDIRQRVHEQCANSFLVNLDLSQVQHVSGGFFGMLCDLNDEGFDIFLHEPHAQIRELIWFRRFFEHDYRNVYRFRSHPHFMRE